MIDPASAVSPAKPPEEKSAAVTGLGIAAIVVGVLSGLLMAGGLLLKALPIAARLSPLLLTQLIGMGLIAGAGAACFGFGLAVGALVHKGGGKVPAIAGALLNAMILMTVSSLALLGLLVGSRAASAQKTQAAALEAGAQAAAQAAADSRASQLKAAAIGMEQAQHDGYAAVTVADLIADPEHHAAAKVCFTGFYSGSSPDLFFVWGQFGKGGSIRVDGSGLSVEKKKDLLNHLDGFHRLLVKGTFGVFTDKRLAGLPRVPAHSVVADEVVDLGRDANPSAE
ncbi:MAG: hypothetical protein ACHQ51_03480 [Elusimicrobiota bacterium]